MIAMNGINKEEKMIIDNENKLLCPICGFDYTHLEKIEEYKEKDNRLCVKLHFYCENGDKFVIDIHQHEGMTYVQ